MLPTGILTLLFTDIEASTRLVQLLGDRYPHLLADHHQILRDNIIAWDGIILDTQGDAFFAVFTQAQDAVAAAVAIQRNLAAHPWPDGLQVRVRMGLHTGEPTLTTNGYYVGLDIHRAARICAAGHGGQVLLSQTTCSLILADLPFGVSLRDLGQHRLKDIDRPERIYQLIIPDLPSHFPDLRSLELFVHNLPTPLTSFIGREKESADVGRALEQYRLVTLIGPGGTGKTRLAIQVATELLTVFIDGVRFVELAPISDPNLLPQTVAGVLGLREEPGKPIYRTISDHLRNKDMLLVLDNCEHLVDAAATLVTHLLTHCSHLKILTSSREALSITGEAPYFVPTLALPPIGSRYFPPIETLTQYEAVRLFIARAKAIWPDFVVTNENAPAVAHICTRLDGIPLAIELAAARVRTLTLEQIITRLNDRFKLLGGNNQRAVPRQKTLRALIDWSYDLLTPLEQLLLQRLSVFVGGWSLEAAEAIVSDDDTLPTEEIIDGLERLVNKSLITVSREQGYPTRYAFLDTIRQYAREKLIEAGGVETVRQRHFEYFLAHVEYAEPRLIGPEQLQWWRWLEQELDNIRSALQWAGRGEQGESAWLPQTPWTAENGLRLAAALWWFWFLRGFLNEALSWLSRLLEKARHEPDFPPLLMAKVLSRTSLIAHFGRNEHFATTLAEEAVTFCEAQQDWNGQAIASFVLAELARSQKLISEAEMYYRQSFALFQKTGNEWGIALVLNLQGWKAFLQGDYDLAEKIGLECLRLRRKIGVTVGVAAALDLLGTIARVKKQYDRAETLLQESLSLVKGLQRNFTTNVTLIQLGHIALLKGEYTQAITFYTSALEHSRELEDIADMIEMLTYLAIVVWREGKPETATAYMLEAVMLSSQQGETASAAALLFDIGKMAEAQDDRVRAQATYEFGLSLGHYISSTERAEFEAMLLTLSQPDKNEL